MAKKQSKHQRKDRQGPIKIKKGRYAAFNFITLTFGICWLMAFAFWQFGLKLSGAGGFFMATIYMFMPAGVVLLIYNKRLTELLELSLKPNRWFLVAILLPLGLSMASLGVSAMLPGVEFSWGMETFWERLAKNMSPEQLAQMHAQRDAASWHPFWMTLIQGVVGGLTINAFFALGEEIGWRGLLVREWKDQGFWRSSLMIGLVWGIWHAPLILMGHNYPSFPYWGVLWMVAFCVLYSPLIQWVRLKANTVAVAALFHGMINGTAGLSFMPLNGGTELSNGILGTAGFMILASANIMLFLFYRPEGKKA